MVNQSPPPLLIEPSRGSKKKWIVLGVIVIIVLLGIFVYFKYFSSVSCSSKVKDFCYGPNSGLSEIDRSNRYRIRDCYAQYAIDNKDSCACTQIGKLDIYDPPFQIRECYQNLSLSIRDVSICSLITTTSYDLKEFALNECLEEYAIMYKEPSVCENTSSLEAGHVNSKEYCYISYAVTFNDSVICDRIKYDDWLYNRCLDNVNGVKNEFK